MIASGGVSGDVDAIVVLGDDNFSGDRAEGVAAFNEKRSPEWPGE